MRRLIAKAGVGEVGLTDAVIGDLFADASLKETAATIAAVNTVMLAVRLVAADFAVDRDWQRSSHDCSLQLAFTF